MSKVRTLPSQERLCQIFHYECASGELFWKERTRELFPEMKKINCWNTRYAGKRIGCIGNTGHIVVNLLGQIYLAHRIIYKMQTKLEPPLIDHIDRNRLNNRIDNLRAADDSINVWNSGKKWHNTSGYKGVVFFPQTNKWSAKVGFNRKLIHGGYFATKEEAHKAACKLRRKLHGEFACDGID